MYIYIIIKLFSEYFAIKNKLDIKYLFMFIEGSIIIGYFYLLYLEELNINKYLLVWCLGWIIFFVSYKSMNYLLVNREKILIQIKQRISEKKIKEIREFFLKPIICDIVYYLIWMLPWNVGYWIYFYIMEHGWYLRIWITSVRDIVILKIFKWDSRMFFFKLNKILYENIIINIIWKIKEEIIKGILRILILISYLRGKILKVTVIEYIINRILVFCYLSMFYLYVFEGIQIINKWIIIILISMEIILVIFSGKILNYIINKEIEINKDKYIPYIIKIFDFNMIWLIVDPLNNNHYEPAKVYFEQNNMVWNKILGNSVSLNILYEYMLYINKNTKGYYYYKYEILTKIKSIKLYEMSNIPWDIIPKTRHIIMSMRYIQENQFKSIFENDEKLKELISLKKIKTNQELNNYILNHYSIKYQSNNTDINETYRNIRQQDLNEMVLVIPNFKIKNCKNLYLSLFEKSYDNTSLLYLNFLLKLNYDINYIAFNNYYYENIIKNLEDNKKIFYIYHILFCINSYKSNIWKLCLIDINKNNPKLLEIEFILHLFDYECRKYDTLEYYLLKFVNTSLENKISILDKNKKYNLNMKQYKKNIKILTHFMFLEEEVIVWNKELINFFNEIELCKKNNDYKDNLLNLVSLYSKYGYSSRQLWWGNQQNLKELLIDDLGVKFNFDINKLSNQDFDFNKSYFFKFLGWKVIDWNNDTVEKDLLKELELIFEDLEEINIKNISKLRLGLNKEFLDKKYEEFKKKNEKNNKKNI